MRSVKSLLAAVASLLVLLSAPAAAPAATACDLGGGVLEVRLPAQGDVAGLLVGGGGEILVLQMGGTPIACGGVGGPPSVSNVNVISVANAPGGIDNGVTIIGPSQFAPGASTVGENGGTPEIEISVNLNDGPGSALSLLEASGTPIRFGDSGINANAVPGEIQPDADIFPTNVSELLATGNDNTGSTLSAQGGAGTGGPLTDPITLDGGAQGDVLVGGEGPDRINGYAGSDTVLGIGGNDLLEVDAGTVDNDSLDGGAGTDEVYIGGGSGVTIDLTIAGPQSTGATGSIALAGIEDIFGTDFADVLRGDGAANRLRGGEGDDVLEGRGGVDALEGSDGADSLLVRDGGADSADCGADLDTATTDAPGVDAVVDCDSVLFPPIPGTDPPGGGGGGGDTPGVTAGRCAGKKATITGTNSGERIRGTRRRDVIDARGGNDRVKALAGNDIVCGGTGRDRLDGGKGRDTLSGGTGNDKLSGSRGNDRLLGGSGRDELVGGSGRDRLLGGAGKDAQRP